MRTMWPDDFDKTVFYETIYNAIYLHSRGGLNRELIPACVTITMYASHAVAVLIAVAGSMIYDQGREMHGHKILTDRTGVQIYFADSHSPWQRGTNENTNVSLRQYMPKGPDLSIYSQEELDAIALSVNTRPRETLGLQALLAAYTVHMARLQLQLDATH
jgi:IS30 family transposase